ncbi:transcriptional regulator ModE [Escherichia coli]|uniref:Transcriptional regulator ModE n=1 Tax=Escherichia coli TaxID=562 RepID=A0A377F7W0_ECOLX|nr:transcriptional regulator ModE [Escherichia coli]
MQAEILLTLKLQQKLFADPRRISLLNTLRFPVPLARERKMPVLAIKAPGCH